MSLHDLIAAAGERLTPTERRIAAAVTDDPTLLAFGTVSDLAGRVRTSRPSIVRFATKLGFEGYTDLQQWVRDGVSRKLSSPSQRIRQASHAPFRQAIREALDHTLEALEGPKLAALAAPLARAPAVWILSGETSLAGARALHSGLAMVRPRVRLVDDHDIGRDLSAAQTGDTAVVIDFERYRRTTVTAARYLAGAGVEIVALTDGPLSPLASITPTWCELRVPAVGPFDSSVTAVTAAELLVAEVVSQLGSEARDRIDRLETLWQTTDTFLEYSPKPARDR